MRYSASEKQEIIRLVEQSHLTMTQTLQKLGVSKSTFYRWYKKWLDHGLEGLDDNHPPHLDYGTVFLMNTRSCH